MGEGAQKCSKQYKKGIDMWDLETIRRINVEGLKAIKSPPPLILPDLSVKIKSTDLPESVVLVVNGEE